MVKKKKDFGEHDKKTAARERRAGNKRDEEERRIKDEEDAFWAEAGEGAMTKAQTKRREQERQRRETLAKRQELKDLALAEEESLSKAKKTKGRVTAPKVTHHALMLEKERVAAEQETKQAEARLVERKEVDEAAYARLVDVANVNRDNGALEARNVSDAIHALERLAPGDATPEDMHPEKRRKAAFKKFYEAELEELRSEKPGLRLSQYKDIIFKRWLKSPENPMNQGQDN